MRHAPGKFTTITTALAVALALSAGACGKKSHKAPADKGSSAGSTAGSTAGSGKGSSATPAPPVTNVIRSTTPTEAIAAPDRPAEDKALDAGRKPVELLTYLGIGRGMKVAEISAGAGYMAELLARVVGPEGAVWAQNSPDMLAKFAEKPWSDRLARLKMPWLVRVDRDLQSPLPPDAKDLDMVVMHLVYHDTVAMGVDRTAMIGGIWAALRAGGMLAIIDHSAKDGTGPDAAKELHRIDAKFVQTEVEHAGFILDRTSNLYENKQDTRDWNASPEAAGAKRGTSDRFVMVFRKQTGQ